MSSTTQKLKKQITDAAGNVLYTYDAHWNIVNRLKRREKGLKISQIALTAVSTGGFLASLITGISGLSWLGGMTSAIALAINLYALNFNMPREIKQHTDAANELWDIRESYHSLITDFEDLSLEDIRARRDLITESVSRINKTYPGTDAKSFRQAQKNIGDYVFGDGEAAKILDLDD